MHATDLKRFNSIGRTIHVRRCFRRRFGMVLGITVTTFAAFAVPGAVLAEDSAAVSVLQTSSPSETADQGSKQKTLLRHQLETGDTLRYRVTHVAKTKTRMNGSEEIVNVHTTSIRQWKVLEATDRRMTFEHSIESVQMTQQTGDKDEIRWDSTSGEDPPRVFSVVAAQIGSPLATVTMNGRGEELNREDHGGTKASLGMGQLTLALPEDPIAVGESWSVPSNVQVRTDGGLVKRIKIRQKYTLEKVKAGVATIDVRSEPLTPIETESVRAQVVQQLSNGSIRFDVDSGVLLEKELNWDETVVGFQGPGSMMEYRARMTEERVADESVQTAGRLTAPLR